MACPDANELARLAPGAVTDHIDRCGACRRVVAELARATAAAGDPSGGRPLAGRFRLVRRLGHGGMGEVYEAEDLALGVRVAVKIVLPELAGDLPAAQLHREVLLARRVAHPNVCRVFDAGEGHGGTSFVTMELVHGETLAARLARGPLSVAEARLFEVQLRAAIAAIHQAGVAHRDLKASNVMLARGGRLVVMDFGLARELDAAAAARDEDALALLLAHLDLTPRASAGTARCRRPGRAERAPASVSRSCSAPGTRARARRAPPRRPRRR